MKVAHIQPLTSQPTRPALEALQAHRAALAEVAAADAEWAQREAVETEAIRACGAAQSHLTALEERRIAAQADRDVLGHTSINTVGLEEEIAEARKTADALIERAQLATARIQRIKDHQREPIRLKRLELAPQLRPFRHSARFERLGASMDALLTAEAAYVSALTEAWGISASIDELALEPGVQLPFAGRLDVGEVFLPRPFHPDFANKASPLKSDIARAIVAVAEQTAKEI